ncbi:MAG: nuclear transport factor 2 family protein [Gammaproteobacteria bacterium]
MNNDLLESFKSNFKDLKKADWSQLGNFYADNILFRDPVHELHGLVTLEDYFNTLCADLIVCRFEFLDQVVDDHSAYLKWIMHFRHPRLGNEIIDVRGVSHLRWTDKIEFHEDFYDMGAMLYERLPVLGNVTRWLRLRLAS